MADAILLVLRWSARISGLLLVVLVVAMTIGHGGPPNVFQAPLPVQIEFCGLFLSLAGFLVGWRREGLGGLLAATGFAIFCATELIVTGRPPGGAIPLFIVPAVLLLASRGIHALRRRRSAVA
jgi:hypothetical protein